MSRSEYMRNWRKNNKDKDKANRQRFYAKHKIRLKTERDEYKRLNPDKVKSSHLKYKYGITLQEWGALFEAQGRRCAICDVNTPTGKSWHTDHDHKTGQVRGILCTTCNLGLGAFQDSPKLLAQASTYLTTRKVETT